MTWKRKSFGKVYRAAKRLSRWQKILAKLLVCKRIFGNQLVSYTRQMDLVRIGDQAKFLNASLRTKHFRIWKVIFQSVSFLKMRFRILLALLHAPNPFGAYRTPIDYRIFEHTYNQNCCWFLDNGSHGRSSQTCPRLFLFFCLLQSGKQQFWNYKQILLKKILLVKKMSTPIHPSPCMKPSNWCMHHIKVAPFSFVKINTGLWSFRLTFINVGHIPTAGLHVFPKITLIMMTS